MSRIQDGPFSNLFTPLQIKGNLTLLELADIGVSEDMALAQDSAPTGLFTGWGIPFEIGDVVALNDKAVSIDLPPTTVPWLIFLHTSDQRPNESEPGSFISPMRGEGQLGEHAADYVIQYADGTEDRVKIRRRFQLGTFQHRWGEQCFEAVVHKKSHPVPTSYEQMNSNWGMSQTRVSDTGGSSWVNWLWAWQNPFPDKEITGIRFEPVSGVVVVSAVSAGWVSTQPLRWQTRRKAVLTLPQGELFISTLDENGLLQQLQLDLGQVISATPRLIYPNERWAASYNNQLPEKSEHEILVEYTAHPDASFHLPDGSIITVAQVVNSQPDIPIKLVAPSNQRVKLRVMEHGKNTTVPVKLHVHGNANEYLAPVDRHRIPNPAWFEDYSVDFIHGATWESNGETPHFCTYIPGETSIDLPLGHVYIEVAKGFEIRPVRQVFEVRPDTREITVEIKKILPWYEQGWVTADTHVHFPSPMTALLEGAAEGVNVVNLLASQWGELMTNVGDFDGKNTWGALETGGDGEYLVRVGTENRQHVLGHISLLGYKGQIIAPMTTGGPNESALGDPVEILLTEWARQCKKQGGLVVFPHFPNPRLEPAATIISNDADAIEMTSWGNLYGGIDPYSLADWYRYLNCGYWVPVVGGTDKMSANTPIGAVRTYARIADDQPFTYDTWMEAIRRAETFVTYGPLIEFEVDGMRMGDCIKMSPSGGAVDVTWQVASVTIPMSRVELIVNGEIRESVSVSPEEGSGHWSINIDKSSWLALLVRGHYTDKPEIITAHSSPVVIDVEDSPILAAADAVTILEQIEGALAYVDTVGTRADEITYKRMRLVLESAHRKLHNRMHRMGHYHDHTIVMDHTDNRDKG
jgi:hypothetical protein